jgi:hypothetical protein
MRAESGRMGRMEREIEREMREREIQRERGENGMEQEGIPLFPHLLELSCSRCGSGGNYRRDARVANSTSAQDLLEGV